MVVLVATAVHLIAICALALMARWMFKRLPDYDRSHDVIGAIVIGVFLIAVMFALPHWGFGR
jgi:hypothetical protein